MWWDAIPIRILQESRVLGWKTRRRYRAAPDVRARKVANGYFSFSQWLQCPLNGSDLRVADGYSYDGAMIIEDFPTHTVTVQCDTPGCSCVISRTESSKHDALIACVFDGWRQGVDMQWRCACPACYERPVQERAAKA